MAVVIDDYLGTQGPQLLMLTTAGTSELYLHLIGSVLCYNKPVAFGSQGDLGFGLYRTTGGRSDPTNYVTGIAQLVTENVCNCAGKFIKSKLITTHILIILRN